MGAAPGGSPTWWGAQPGRSGYPMPGSALRRSGSALKFAPARCGLPAEGRRAALPPSAARKEPAPPSSPPPAPSRPSLLLSPPPGGAGTCCVSKTRRRIGNRRCPPGPGPARPVPEAGAASPALCRCPGPGREPSACRCGVPAPARAWCPRLGLSPGPPVRGEGVMPREQRASFGRESHRAAPSALGEPLGASSDLVPVPRAKRGASGSASPQRVALPAAGSPPGHGS